jgi:hypothetical protein
LWRRKADLPLEAVIRKVDTVERQSGATIAAAHGRQFSYELISAVYTATAVGGRFQDVAYSLLARETLIPRTS